MGTVRMCAVVVWALSMVAGSAAASPEGRLDPRTTHRGVAFLSSCLGAETTIDEITTFVETCEIDLVVVDFAWITHHWPRADRGMIQRLAAELAKSGVHVAAMYRPRLLIPQDAKVHVAVNADGSTPISHNSLCFAHQDSVEWGAKWGTQILESVPAISTIVLYNLGAKCNCSECREGQCEKHVSGFLEHCRTAWKRVRPDVRIGHVGIGAEYAEQVDLLCPFLCVNADSGKSGAPVDIAGLVSSLGTLKSRNRTKPVIPLAKICWASATDNTTEDVINTIETCSKQKIGFLLWYYEWIFHSSDNRYDPKAILAALGGDWQKMSKYLENRNSTNAGAQTGSPNWIYFEGKESQTGTPPQLVLSLRGGTRQVPVAADTVLISYLADKTWGILPHLSISLNDTNRDLLSFDLPKRVNAGALRSAELVLDMKNSERMPVTGAFDLAVHAVLEEWNEHTTCWNNQPAFAPEAAKVARIEPVAAATVRIDLTDLVKEWLKKKTPNHGILLKVAAITNDSSQSTAAASTAGPPDLTFPHTEKKIEKLPWPHQAPGLARNKIERLNREVWIINDFPLYQAGESGEWRYFHGGLDIVLENGTKIYAMQDGWVKAVILSTVTIADAEGDEPSYGWSYSHLGNFQVEEGDFVKRGTVIGEIDFKGLPHIHLTKVFSEGPHWKTWQYICMPNGHFTYTDDDPPVISTPFYFFENNSDKRIEPSQSGNVTVKGDVDIVVAMREAGKYAHGASGFGDRLGVTRMDYEIVPVSRGKKRTFRSFDFGILKMRKGFYDKKYHTELTRVIYKHYTLLDEGKRSGDKVFSYYVLTNCKGDEPPVKLNLGDVDYCWPTAEKDKRGKSLYPDGKYKIVVTAHDFDGNQATESMTVTVDND